MTSREYPDRPWIGIGVIVLRGEEVLLVRRGKPPRMGEWSLPGGAQHVGETAEAAARRELLEETGVTVGPLELAAVVDSIVPDEAGAVRFHYTIVDFCARWVAGEPRAACDVTEAAFVAPADLPGYRLTPEAERVIALARCRV
ncbi:NUDIX hydrolase [Roseomonas sp. NAR14]|uniref:NUDIX hydrolase n=1 Tax=Roseomonas acroporae TaxID=2937791 RepID=A0A9X1YAK0_9PROT|nr:NUDIX hydrolase [Roseomonas acroporae]MCK8782911.1 NUDIX hydrolase [Roseomonas acroporae]